MHKSRARGAGGAGGGWLSLAAAAAVFVLLSGCAHKPEGPVGLHPALSSPTEGYSSAGEKVSFTNGALSLNIRHERDPGDGAPELFKALSGLDYLLIRVVVENLSSEKVIFKPSHAVLRTNRLDYMRPLDYTDLYDIASSGGNGSPRSALSEVKGRFYDLDVMIMPDQRSSRLLIFRPIAPKSSKASLAIRDLYVGTEPIDILFPFEVRAGQ